MIDWVLNCLSNIYLGDETLSTTLRAGTAITLNLKAQELASHEIYDLIPLHADASLSQETYRAVSLSDEENIGDCLHFKEKIQAMALETCENQRWSVFMHMIALSMFLKRPIWSIYPDANKAVRPLLHRQIFTKKTKRTLIYIMWTRDGDLDARKWSVFAPNHFVSR